MLTSSAWRALVTTSYGAAQRGGVLQVLGVPSQHLGHAGVAGGLEVVSGAPRRAHRAESTRGGSPRTGGPRRGRVADLRTGAIRARTRADLIERSVSAAPSKEWRDTRWAAFLEEMIDADALEWLRVLCGYALTGLTREHVLVFIYGRERTGKGTLLSAIADAVGDYSRRIDADDLMEQTGREHPAWLADLRGRRVVVADEMPRGKRWNTARVKKLVSGEPIRARLMHRDFFEFKPTAQVIVAGNHAPQQSSADTGLERRLRVVRAERQPDVEDVRLLDKLKPEHVLSWLLEGAAQYHVEGLRPTPASVAAGTRAYAEQSDILREFLATIADWPQVRAEMYRKYRAWTEIDGGKPLGLGRVAIRRFGGGNDGHDGRRKGRHAAPRLLLGLGRFGSGRSWMIPTNAWSRWSRTAMQASSMCQKVQPSNRSRAYAR